MRITDITAFRVRIPFRRAFEHSAATRQYTDNLLLRIRFDVGAEGWGESIARRYLTGESLEGRPVPEKGLPEATEEALVKKVGLKP